MKSHAKPVSYSLGQAAKATGLSKMTIQRAVKTGKISAFKNDDGSYTIEPVELHRVFPPVTGGNSLGAGLMLQSDTPPDMALRLVAAEARAEKEEALRGMLEVRIRDMEDHIQTLKEDRDAWRSHAQLALIDARQRPTAARGGLFGLFRRRVVAANNENASSGS